MNSAFLDGKYIPDLLLTDEHKESIRRHVTNEILKQIGYDYDLSSVDNYADAGKLLSEFARVTITLNSNRMEDTMRERLSKNGNV